MAYYIFLMLLSAIWGLWAARLAETRGRDKVVWAIVGVLLGLIGVFIIAVLPPVKKGKVIDKL